MDDDIKVTFFGKVFNRKADPENERKVLSFDKYEKREDGTWKNIRAIGILYEDDSITNLPEHLVIKPASGDKNPNHIMNCYYVEGSRPYKPKPKHSFVSDIDDEDIPF